MIIKKRNAFTLIEILVGITIVSIVFIVAFRAYNTVLIGKVQLIESGEMQKRALYFSEKFFEEIKKGGTIDYEEYFNRKTIGTTLQINGHYKVESEFGNKGAFTKCSPPTGSLLGCAVTGDQRYTQYALQHIPYKAGVPLDAGNGPTAFDSNKVKEIYLISGGRKRRTLFRWNIKNDVKNPMPCNTDSGVGGCLSTIEVLRLEGKDWGLNHDKNTDTPGDKQGDGVIDTWLIDKEFAGGAGTVAAGGGDPYWQPLFGDNINVKDLKFYIYPQKDTNLAWEDITEKNNIAPYLRIQMTLEPAYSLKARMKGNNTDIKISTTIALTDIYSQ